METTPFSAEITQQTEAILIHLQGEIDGFAEDGLKAAYAEASRQANSPVILDFSGVNYINSTGIALIIELMAEARKTHRSISTFGLSPHYREIFEITRLADFMRIYPDRTSALAEAGSPPTRISGE